MEDHAVEPVVARPRGGAVAVLALVGCALAATVASAIAPAALAHVELDMSWWFTLAVAPVMLFVGILRCGRFELLAGAPIGWVLPGFHLPTNSMSSGLVVTALVSLGAYLVAALWWLRAMAAAAVPDELEWRAAPVDRGSGGDGQMLAFAAFAVVAGPGVAVVAWPPIRQQAVGMFPALDGLITVGLVLIGTLMGLRLAAGLARERAPRRGRAGRAVGLAVTAGVCAAILWTVRS